VTQHRNDPGRISNYFDKVLAGIGHRGSSFMDVDAVTHDGGTKRWLIQEFKHEGEPLDKAQHWMLKDLATLPKWFTVWVVVRRHDGQIGFAEYKPGQRVEAVTISVDEYQDRFRSWWSNTTYVRPERPVSPPCAPLETRVAMDLAADEIGW